MAQNNIDFNSLLQQLKQLGASTREVNALQRAFKQATEGTEEFEGAIELATSKIKQLQAEAANLNTPFQTLNKIIQANAAELSNQNNPINLQRKALNKIANISRDLVFDNQGIVDLSEKQLKKKLEDLEIQREILRQNGYKLDNLEEEDAGLAALIAKTKQRLNTEESINDNLGVAGALIGGAGALMERLGMRSGIFHKAMQDANEEMRESAKNMGDVVSFANKLSIAATGFKEVSKGFGKALLDPTSMVLKIVSVLSEINKQSVEFTRLTGQAASEMNAVSTEAATAVDLMRTASEFTKQTGLNAATIFTPEQIGQIADAQELLGISAEQATTLGFVMQQTGRSANKIGEAIYNNVSAGVSQKAVYDDVLSASEDIVASSGGNVEELGRAANAAKKLGLNLAKINQIADGLLDFESSISNELEAQLLTGKNINLSKARTLALNNDLEGVANELAKNGASAAEFAEMNRIQQQALAKSLGVSRQELAKMVLTEEARANMTAEQIAKARGVSLEQSKQIDIQARLQKSLFKLAEAFTPILEAVIPFVELLGKGANAIAPYTPLLLGAYGAVKLIKSGIHNTVSGMFNFSKGIIKAIKNFDILNAKQAVFGKFYKGGQFMPGGERAKKGGQRAGGLFSKALGKGDEKLTKTADKTQEVAKKSKNVPVGKNIRKFLQNIATGLRSLGDTKVLFGAANLIPASIGFIAMIPGAVGMAAIAALGKPTSIGLQALGRGLTSFGTAMLGPGGVGLLAFVGAAVGLGAAFALVGAGAMMFGKGIEFAANGVTKIFNGLTGLISSIPQLYLLGGALMSIAAGLGSIAIAGISAIPALAALGTLAVVSAPLITLGGLFESDDNGGDNSEMVKLLKEIRDEVKQGGDVYLDGNKVGEALVLGSYISS